MDLPSYRYFVWKKQKRSPKEKWLISWEKYSCGIMFFRVITASLIPPFCNIVVSNVFHTLAVRY